jgi:hypothetical protein
MSKRLRAIVDEMAADRELLPLGDGDQFAQKDIILVLNLVQLLYKVKERNFITYFSVIEGMHLLNDVALLLLLLLLQLGAQATQSARILLIEIEGKTLV